MKRIIFTWIILAFILVLSACSDLFRSECYECDSWIEINGDLYIMAFNGSGAYFEDMGWIEDPLLTTQVEAQYYALSKQFNLKYPNLKIHFLAFDSNGLDYDIEYYKTQYETITGNKPDLWYTTNLGLEVINGSAFDLSRFNEDPYYKAINSDILLHLNYDGVQAALPAEVYVEGIYINQDLINEYQLEVPDPDWTMEEYTAFTTFKQDDIFGLYGTSIDLIESGSDIRPLRTSYLNSTFDISSSVISLLPYVDTWQQSSYIEDSNNTTFNDIVGRSLFFNNRLLTNHNKITRDEDQHLFSTEPLYDIYPRPSTDFSDNSVGIEINPLVVHNYCMDDGDKTCSDNEIYLGQRAYTFAMFKTASTDALEVMAEQMYNASGIERSSLGMNLPVTTGQLFDEQMAVWFSIAYHTKFADHELTPGFYEVLRVYEEHTLYLEYPTTYFGNDTIFEEWTNWYMYIECFNDELCDPYSEQLETLFGEVEEDINQRLTQHQQEIKSALDTYYK